MLGRLVSLCLFVSLFKTSINNYVHDTNPVLCDLENHILKKLKAGGMNNFTRLQTLEKSLNLKLLRIIMTIGTVDQVFIINTSDIFHFG